MQNGVDRRRLGVAMGTTTFLRGLGGASAPRPSARCSPRASAPARRTAPRLDAVQTVFLVAAPLAAVALLIVLALPETTNE